MELFNSLYTITADSAAGSAAPAVGSEPSPAFTAASPDASRHSYAIKLNPEHFIYKAHFPGEPITPGVCILQIALELLIRHIGSPLFIDTVKNVKFLKVITPVENPEVVYCFQKVCTEEAPDKGGVLVSCQLTVTSLDGNEVFAKISLLCKNAR